MMTSFAMFMVEGMVNYTIGLNSQLPKDQRKFVHIPDKESFVKLAISVAVFSYLTGEVVKLTSKWWK